MLTKGLFAKSARARVFQEGNLYLRAGLGKCESLGLLAEGASLAGGTYGAAPFFETSLASLAAQGATNPVARAGFVSIPEDVRSIRRLRTSKAVCLPSDIPMHVVCGSKDVIHS